LRRCISVFVMALVMALMMYFGGMAFAKITDTKTNGGCNTPNGKANGVPSVSKNPADHQPPGQNK
jgi:hypothetical protein